MTTSSPRSSTRGRRGRGGGPSLTTIWWRDIPVQVMATGGGEPVRAELPNRFTVAVDAAAMEAGLEDSSDYLSQWDRRTRPCGPDLADEVAAEVTRLVAAHPRPVLQALVRAGGRTADADARPGRDPEHSDADPEPSPAAPTTPPQGS